MDVFHLSPVVLSFVCLVGLVVIIRNVGSSGIDTCWSNCELVPRQPDKCTNRMDLANYSIRYMPKFTNVNEVTELNLSHNILRSVPRDSFKNLTQLEIVDLSFNEIFLIHEEAFGNNSSLRKIYLQENSLAFIHMSFYDKFPNLELVDLHGNMQLCLICRNECDQYCRLGGILKFEESLKENCNFRAECNNHFFFRNDSVKNCHQTRKPPSCFLTTEIMTSTARLTSSYSVDVITSTRSLTTQPRIGTVNQDMIAKEAEKNDVTTGSITTYDFFTSPAEVYSSGSTVVSLANASNGSEAQSSRHKSQNVNVAPKSRTVTMTIPYGYLDFTIYLILGGTGLIFNMLTIPLVFCSFWKIHFSFRVTKLHE